jgi:hypothetical protein
VSPDDEAERQELMAQRDADDPGWRERFQPGSFGSREARHLTSALADLERGINGGDRWAVQLIQSIAAARWSAARNAAAVFS